MRRIFPIFILLLIAFSAKALDANISYATFKGIDQDNYIEVYLHILGKTVDFTYEEGRYEAAIEVLLTFKQNGDIKTFDKYVVKSPLLGTKKMANLGVVDMRRMNLPDGVYDLEIALKDLNNLTNTNKYSTKVEMDYKSEEVTISDIQLVDKYKLADEENKYTKHGFMLNPFTYTIYPSYISKISFFTEIYNTDKVLESTYLVRYFIKEEGSDKEPITGSLGFKKQQPNKVNVLLAALDISKIPTGIYHLVIEVRDKENKLISAKSLRINRSNLLDYDLEDYEKAEITASFVENLDKETVRQNIQSLLPKISQNSVRLLNNMVRCKDLEVQKKFLLHYWTSFDEIDPSQPYEQYMELVDYVNDKFDSSFGRGYASDRGHVYLKYGPPTDFVSVPSEPSSAPYEIWYYDMLNNQQGVKFVFYNPTLAGEDYVLLHSTARGEFSDPQWQKRLYETIQPTSGKDALEGTTVPSHFGGNADTYFNNW